MLTLLSAAKNSLNNASNTFASCSRACASARESSRPREQRGADHGFVMVDEDNDDEFEIVDSEAEQDTNTEADFDVSDVPCLASAHRFSSDGFEEQRVYGGSSTLCKPERSATDESRANAANAAPALGAKSKPNVAPFEPKPNAFTHKHLSRDVSVPVRNIPTAPVGTQVGLRTGRKPGRSVIAPALCAPRRMVDSTVD